MASVPYPCFKQGAPVAEGRQALAAVGRCRVDLTSESSLFQDKFQEIIDRNRQQALVGIDNTAAATATTTTEQEKEQKKEKKKYMKQGNAMASDFLTQHLQLDVSVIDVEVVVDPQALLDTDGCLAACLLDAGCAMIVTNGTNLDALEAAQVPRERLQAHFASWDDINQAFFMEHQEQIAQLCEHVSFEMHDTKYMTASAVEELLQQVPDNLQVSICLAPGTILQGDETTTDLSQTVQSMSRVKSRATVCLMDPSPAELGYAYAACLTTDRTDGLYTTVVCTRSGEALGLVYSSATSIVAALECGRGVYYSRSRQGLWRKGDTSGHYQTLHRLDVDCDGDALRFTVTQRGEVAAFCHLNTLTCWGPPRGVRHLEETLQDRLTSAPEGSYTKRLFDDADLLRDKLVEEAQELAEADTKQHVAEELADVLYFAMTRAIKAGVSIDDAVAELDKRARKVTRRKGDSKAFRIAAGQAILGKSKEEGA